MQDFAALLDRIAFTSANDDKIAVLAAYLSRTRDPDRGYALALITKCLPITGLKSGFIRDMARQRVDPALFAMSREFVGDLTETVSLTWPARHGANRAPGLSDVIEALVETDKQDWPQLIAPWMDALDPAGRWVLLKLVTGGVRVSLSADLARKALARLGDVHVHQIDEIWHGLSPPYLDLFAWLEGKAKKPAPDDAVLFRPLMLAHGLADLQDLPDHSTQSDQPILSDIYAVEWKWDGARVQAASNGKDRKLYSRSGDDLSPAFPDIIAAMNFDAVIDGELMIRSPDGGVAPFGELQKRLDKKTASKTSLIQQPAFIRAYDILRDGEEDIRRMTFIERRKRLERLISSQLSDRFDLSTLLSVSDPAQVGALRQAPPTPEISGIILKRWDSSYIAGRPERHWFKLKRDPYLINAVLLYVQRDQGGRNGAISELTFGVWRRGQDSTAELVPVGKAKCDVSPDAQDRLNTFAKEHSGERFGPVTAISANADKGLILEIAFEGVVSAPRRKSGIVLRSPRINQLLWDKRPDDADGLHSLVSMTAR